MVTDSVRAWAETVTIPTVLTGAPDKNPIFLEKRVYQGSSGVVYPHPVIDRIEEERIERAYQAVYLENRYLKIMILPEIGGRVQMALDKTNGYHFVYYNHVIKPALVGLAGPWISGGIEFNWPQHHRPSTFDPLDWRIDENPNGSKTVWCSEIERMFNTKGMHGFTLYMDRAYLEIKVQLYNRTSEPQTFLWWANPAVHVNDDYQSVFPPDVHAVMDHGKRDVSTFPIATGTYYKVNYAPGTNISRYKNIPVPTSYMAYHSDYDFVGDYDHGQQAGMMHIANHHTVPGKKQWTWGHGDFGRTWDRQLTDEDGPYIELMCGAYTDNQPDFSWIMPGEEKSFSQVFMPYKLIGPASNASKEAVLRLEVSGQQAEIGVYVTRPRTVTVELLHTDKILFQRKARLDPETVLKESIQLPAGSRAQDVTLRLRDESGHDILSFTPLPEERPAIPAPATAALPPGEIQTQEQLFLNGLHLEQYRHATYLPEHYYEEALRRDAHDARCNNAMGLLLYRRGKFAEAEPYFRRAIARLTERNSNPYDGEPFYNLGLALKMQGRLQDAIHALYKAVWNASWQEAAYFELARIQARLAIENGSHPDQMEEALDLAARSLLRGWTNHRARHLKIALLRRLGRHEEARQEIELALNLDRMEFGALWEQYLLDGGNEFRRLAGDRAYTYTAIALDYAHCGLWQEALALLTTAPQEDPMVNYYTGWVLEQSGQPEKALKAFRQASSLPPDYVFPNQVESVLALQAAIRLNPSDPRAPYYLGNFWYAHRRYSEAIEAWESSARLDPSFATVFRNLGLAYFNKSHDPARSRQAYETAHTLAPNDARLFFELDQLYKKLNLHPGERLSRMEACRDLVDQRDDLTAEFINLLILEGQYYEALEILEVRSFHPWEGGEGKIAGAYVKALLQKALDAIRAGQSQEAIASLEAARTYPPNLGEGKLPGALENHILYMLGLACESAGFQATAREWFEKASVGLSEPTSAKYYNDQPPEMIFYQGLALQHLGQKEDAQQIFEKLVQYGQSHLNDQPTIDYFAVSLPEFAVFEDDLGMRNQVHCRAMMALGFLGLGQKEEARHQVEEVLALDASHWIAVLYKENL